MNRGLIDAWTVAHVAAGVAAGMLGVGFMASMLGAGAYEIAEQGIERQEWGRRLFGSDGPESGRNVASDLVVFAVGHVVGRHLRSAPGELGGELL